MRYETIYFDLDGTLTDSGPGITNSVAYALTRMAGRFPPAQPEPVYWPPAVGFLPAV